jgi:hypothetical protein
MSNRAWRRLMGAFFFFGLANTAAYAASLPTSDMYPAVVDCTFEGHTIASLRNGVLFITDTKDPVPNAPGVLYRNGLNSSAAMDVTVDYTHDFGFGKVGLVTNGVHGLCTIPAR